MEGKVFSKIISKLKKSTKDNTTGNLDYAFSIEEINTLDKQNKEKIKELKNKNIIDKKKKAEEKKKEKELTVTIVEEKLHNEQIEEEKQNKKEEEKEVKIPKKSYVNLSKSQEKIIMDNWKKIDIIKLDEVILKGKDILAHNYSISYADDSLAFIYKVRAEYDILIEYLIGFNNEKKGTYNKTIFSDKMADEWHYLDNYIKVLEKIRSIKK